MRNKRLIALFSILTLVTVCAVLGSVLFSVQNVYAACYNYDDEAYDAQIADLDVNGIKRGHSIFLLNEDEIAQKIEKKYPDVRVVNVERKFPNQVYINYARIFEYYAVETAENVLFASNECKVLRTGELQPAYTDHIKLLTNEAPNTTVNELLFSQNGKDYQIAVAVMDAVERMDLHSAAVEMLETVDLRYADKLGLTYIKTRTGTVFELQGGARNIDKKLQLAVAVYFSNETKYMSGGTVIVNGSADGAWYSADDLYAARLNADQAAQN